MAMIVYQEIRQQTRIKPLQRRAEDMTPFFVFERDIEVVAMAAMHG